jgi:hypothetical protein
MLSPNFLRRLLRWTLRIGLGLAALYLLGIFGLTLWAQGKLGRALERVTGEGYVLELEELLPDLAPDERNASHTLDAIASLLEDALRRDGEELGWRPETETLDAAAAGDGQALAALEERLAHPDRRLVLDLLDRAAGVEHARFLEAGSGPPALVIDPRWNLYAGRRLQLLRAGRWLAARSALEAGRDRIDDAVASTVAIFRLADWMEQESPLIVAGLFSQAEARWGYEALERLTFHSRLGAAQRRQVETALEDLHAGGRARHLRGELAMGNAFHRQMLWLPNPAAPPPGLWLLFRHRVLGRWLVAIDHAAFLEAMSGLIRRAEQPPYRRDPLEEVDDGIPGVAIPTKLLIPNFLAAVEKSDELFERRDLARIALAWQAFAEARGTSPASLRELVPEPLAELPVDTFTGEPLDFRRGEGGCLVWSVGPDLRNDGGENAGTPAAGDADDPAWRLPCS